MASQINLKPELEFYDFSESLVRVKNLFGGYYDYTESQIKWLYKIVNIMTVTEWTAVVDSLPQKFEKLPTVKQLLDEARPKLQIARKARIAKLIAFHGMDRCGYCDSSGVIDAELKNQPHMAPFMFRCNKCEFSDLLNLSRSIDKWDDKLLATYDITAHKVCDDPEAVRWKEIYKAGGFRALSRAVKFGPDKIWEEISGEEF